MEAANMSENEEVALIRSAITAAKAARDFIQHEMKTGKRPMDFAELKKWSDDIRKMEEHLRAA